MKFKVGDRVRIVLDDNSHHAKSDLKDKVSKIKNVDNNIHSYPINLHIYGMNWRESELRLFTVKNTAIARAYYKNRIEKIENNEIYLK